MKLNTTELLPLGRSRHVVKISRYHKKLNHFWAWNMWREFWNSNVNLQWSVVNLKVSDLLLSPYFWCQFLAFTWLHPGLEIPDAPKVWNVVSGVNCPSLEKCLSRKTYFTDTRSQTFYRHTFPRLLWKLYSFGYGRSVHIDILGCEKAVNLRSWR